MNSLIGHFSTLSFCDLAARSMTRLIFLGFLSALSAPALSNDYSVVPDQFVYCTTCHGVELQGNRAVDAPRLNGMEDWYVRNQLQAFREGWRGSHDDLIGMEMRPQATVLDADDVEAAVAFVASVPRRRDSFTRTVNGDVSRGQTLYASCAACHGNQGEGNKTLNAPKLRGQSDWYLVRQLEKFRSGVRGGAPGDIYGLQMRASVSVLPDEAAINDVVTYINSLE
jgi:cytochrome c553